ncbi:MAG: hypothetical protein RL716_142 [Actinomycetota bacterium]|jgi:hypothetical protein
MSTSNTFGRVDADNNVFVIEAGQERKVGQYPGVSPEEALAYFERKFSDLNAQVRLLEQRVAGKLDAAGLQKAAAKLTQELIEPAAVGDIAYLRRRVSDLDEKIRELTSEKSEQNKEAAQKSLAEREAIVAQAETISNQDASKTQWKNSAAEMAALFDKWQAVQKSGPKVSKSDADALWKRFSAARTKFDAAKRQYFASLDATNKQARNAKNEIVAQAEALVSRGAEATADYRKLLDAWKSSGRTPGKSDDALWSRFKAAGDAIFAARASEVVVESAEQNQNLEAKLAILKDAASIDPQKDLATAKKQLLAIQQRWEKAGRVPKDKLRETEDKLRAIEQSVRKAEEEHWRKTDPAAIDRSNGVISQLEDSIAKLEADLAAAKAKKDAKATEKATEALNARKAWLEVVVASMK